MGITEILAHVPRIYRAYRRLVRSVQETPPDIAILIDFPDVNFRLARHLRRLGVPVVWFASPQLWAWKRGRLRWVQSRVDRMLVLFPFEQRFYQDVIGHVHVFGRQGAWRTLNLDIDKFEALRLHGTLGFQKLLVSVFASPAKTGNAKVGYSTATGRDIGAWHVEGRDFAKAFAPHRTLFVDIEIPRVVDPDVFRFRK